MRLVASILLCVVLALPQAANAQSADDVGQAKIYFQAGQQAYDSGQFDAAALAFEEAYRLVPRPAIVFSMAQAYRRQYFVDRDQNKLLRAVDLFRQYLKEMPKGGRRLDASQHLADLEPLWERAAAGRRPTQPDQEKRSLTQLMVTSRTKQASATIDDDAASEVPVVRVVTPGKHKMRVTAPGHFEETVEGVSVEGRLVVVEVTLKPKPATLLLRAPSGAMIAVDGRPIGRAPLASFELDAGRHFVSVTRRGHRPFSRELELVRGQKATLDAPLATTAQRRASYWVLASAGGLFTAALGTSLWSLERQSAAQDILDKKNDQMNLSSDELERYGDLRDRRNTLRTASYWLFGAAAVTGTAGVLLYLADDPQAESPVTPKNDVRPAVGAGSIGAVWSGQF